MAVLGSYPSHRYNRAWIVQRLFNRLPDWSQARKSPTSYGQQFLNPIATDIQDTYQQLARARYDQFISTADLSQLDHLYRADLLPEMEFQYNENSSGIRDYIPPAVYAVVNGTEYQLTQAEENNIETLNHDNLPSRIEDSEVSYSYDAVIPQTAVSSLGSISPEAITIPGHLYITIKGNSTWEERTHEYIYYPKIYITGTTRKGTGVTEAVPLRYNGTFKTINEWNEVSSIFVSYLDDTATIAIETFPQSRESYLDDFNICVPVDGGERMQFTRLGTRSFGSTFIAEAYTLANMDIVRSGVDDKDIFYELELLDEVGLNVDLVDFIHRPNTRFIYAVDDTKLYVYDVNLSFPEVEDLRGESEDAKIDLESDKWILTRGETAKIYTHNIDMDNLPYRVRWHVLDPDDNEFYMGLDGSMWPTTTDAWLDNELYDQAQWREQEIEFSVSETGRYIISLEAEYFDETTNTNRTLITKFLFFLPEIRPEVEFDLPLALQSPSSIGIDSDNNIWLELYDGMHKLDMFFDYFLVDYERRRVYLKEEYSSVRINTGG